MFHSKLKLLIVIFILNIYSLAASDAKHNTSTRYYRNPTNLTTPTAPSHYAVVNDTIFATHGGVFEATMEANPDDVVAKRVVSHEYETHLDRSSVIFGLTKVVNASNVNPYCHRQLKHIQHAILRKEPWAMKALDSSGTKASGFVFGQNFWLGSREACGAVQNTVGITLSKRFNRVMNFGIINERAPFDMDYRVVYLRHQSPWQVEIKLMSEQIIHIGLCLPSTCASSEIQSLLRDYVDRGFFVENTIYDLKPEVVYMKDLKLSESFYQRKSFQLACAVIAFTCAMLLAAFCLHFKPTVENAEPKEKLSEQATQSNGTPQRKLEETSVNNEGSLQNIKNFVKCYDVQANCEKLFLTRPNTPNDIPVIDGVRSVCAVWIMFFHVIWYMFFTVNNKAFLISNGERFIFQYISSAPLLVDVFFTISGFLQTYNFLRNTKQMDQIRQNNFSQNMKQFLKILFHRYLRLAPLYLVVVGLVDILFAYMSEVSVFHIFERFDENCSKYWWRNMFFIQNFFNHQDMCLNWTWSLACDMQFFLLATILLFAYAKNPKLVKYATGALLAANIIWTFGIGMNVNFQFSFDTVFETGTSIYMSPFVRILPYIVGSISAWFMMERQMQFDLSDLKEKCIWNLSILLFFICIHSTIKRDLSVLPSVLLLVFGRINFSLTICWIIIGSATGRGSWWSRILETKILQHCNRLSYAFYLLNPFFIALFFGLADVSTHADPFMLSLLCAGFAVVVYVASIAFSLAFEIPYSNWSSLMLRRGKQKSL